MNLFPADAGVFGRIPEAKFSENGSFTIEDVSPGKYRVQPPHVSGTYLSAVRFGQQDFLDKDLDLTTGASGELEITLRYGTGELTGSIQFPDTSNGHPTGSVVLISTDNRSENPHIESTSTNQDGSFSIKDITPGTYRAYAFEEITHSSLQNPDVRAQLTSLGKEVKIQENGTQQIQLTLIPADTLQGIYSRLGIESE